LSYEYSYGIVPLRRVDRGIEVLLVHHVNGHWTLPKGHAEPNETPWQTAQRELLEETGLQVDQYLSLPTVQERYPHGDREKVATYFIAWVSGTMTHLPSELQGSCWCSPEDALEKLTYEETRESLRRALGYCQ
jgi:bis(5'-nucleosidyl)-tetraphosphatase